MTFNADVAINPVDIEYNGGFIDDNMSREILNQIHKKIAKGLEEENEEQRSKREATVKQLTKLLQELEGFYKTAENKIKKYENTFSYYGHNKGGRDFGKYIFQKREDVSYEQMFRTCSDILNILRSYSLDEGIQLVVIKSSGKDDNGETHFTNVYFGDEHTLKDIKAVQETFTDKKTNEKKVIEKITYVTTDKSLTKMYSGTGMKEAVENSLFGKHYNEFKNLINDDRLKNLKKRYGGSGGSINEGHITEAYMRHLYFKHKITEISREVIDNFNPTDKITPQEFAIQLYYSINNDAWYTGGDIFKMQIKGDNKKLASLMSVKAVCSALFDLIQDMHSNKKNKFDVKRFNSLFTQEDQIRMSKRDPERLAKKELDELISMIGSKSIRRDD